VSGVAHELNNPLAAVTSYAQLLLDNPRVTADERHAVDTILQEAKRAAKIVSNLLTFARQHQSERSAADINRVVTETVRLRRFALGEQRIELALDLDPHLPPTWADSFQIQQVLLNLMANAEHALEAWEGERRLTITTRYHNGTVTLRVTDSGHGIDEAIMDQIFNPFFTTKGVGAGTGLGLSISDGIVREHGGRLRAEQGSDGGASFVVELPYVDPVAGFFNEVELPGAPGTSRTPSSRSP